MLLPATLGVALLTAQVCASDAACASGTLCTAPPRAEASTCHARCAPGCAAGERCTVLRPPDDERWPRAKRRYVCTREPPRLCEPCARDEDCGALLDRCLELLSGERVCGRDCSWDDACPAGYRCADPGAVDGRPARRQCIPEEGCCACDQGFLAAPTPPAAAGTGVTPTASPARGGPLKPRTPASLGPGLPPLPESWHGWPAPHEDSASWPTGGESTAQPSPARLPTSGASSSMAVPPPRAAPGAQQAPAPTQPAPRAQPHVTPAPATGPALQPTVRGVVAD